MRVWTTHLIAVLATALAVSAPSVRASAQPYDLTDSLRGSSSGNVMGGSFSAEGWTITDVGDRIWYPLPRLQSGWIELTVSNITLGNLPLADHEIFAMYEAGYGIGEPIDYNPEFRQNHYKILMRLYGTAEADRAGFMKLMFGMCPSGAPGWYDASGCGCESFFQEPFADPGPWSGAPVRIRVEWGGGTTRLLRDGVEVVAIDWSGSGLSFGPQELHMMLGSPRNDGGLSAMPIGAVFSDLVIHGEMGPLAMCPGTTTPDAGVPPDAGACASAGLAIADGIAASWEAGVFPDANDLNVEGDGTAPTGIAYLRFPAVAGVVTSATLRLRVASTTSAGGDSGEVCRVEAGAWDESTLTWSTRPALSTVCSGGARSVAIGEEVTWDVTSLITGGGEPTLAIVSSGGDGVHYLSRESGGCEQGPRLDVVVVPGSDAGMVPGIDAGSMDASSTAIDAGGRVGVEAGCGCRVGGGTRTPATMFVTMLALALALTRRRRNHRERARAPR